MKRVVLFKSESEDYRRAFSDHDYEVIFVEPLHFTYVNLAELDEKLNDKGYTGLIVTSPRAVEAAAQRWTVGKFEVWRARRLYAVGAASARQARGRLGLDVRGAAAGSAAALADLVLAENTDPAKFLFPCGNLSSETLPDMLQSKGISVDSLTVYETKENENLREELIKLSALECSLCCMVFFSPSGCEYIHRQLQTFSNGLTQLPYFAIGNSTAHKIENLGVEIAGVAEKPTPESITESVQKYFASGASS
ncbi:hypothetical protein MSG28_008371 [Choristoneura fumiferana]|uniref:Uncharacterized protein n=1 Tax=Choristoneura fumiferana TaxID=7141 RepID=A0ACC0J6Q4_CHOFU|nr:hypothetical protein MSG28_008371 [Choristoneura fumiferana]